MHTIYNDHNSFRICSESKNTIKLGYMGKREKKNEKRREKRISKRKEICFELSKNLSDLETEIIKVKDVRETN